MPFSEFNALENPAEDIAKINYDITGGTFISTGDKTVSVEDFANGPFVSGGEYSHKVDEEYIVEGYTNSFIKLAKNEEEYYNVVPLRTASLDCGEDGSAFIYLDIDDYGADRLNLLKLIAICP